MAERAVATYHAGPESGPKAEARDQYRYTRLLGFETTDPLEISRRILQGLPYRAMEHFQKTVGLPLARVAALIHIPPRTLSRRKDMRRLEPDESDRLARLSRIVGAAVDLFEGDLAAARSWLSAPLRSLKGQAPLDVVATDVGVREVEALIGRLEHGVVA